MGLIYSNIPELEGTDTDIVLTNLKALEKELGEAFEKRIAHLCELGRAILKDGGDPDVVKSIILSIRPGGEPDAALTLKENEKEIKSFFSDVSILERLIVFNQVFGEKSFDLVSIPSAIDQTAKSVGKIAYVKNSYNDLVFAHFSTLLDGAKAAYYSTLSDVCESVTSGDAEFCILPIETGKDGTLMSFYDAICSNGLKINAEYDLKSIDAESYTRYALLSSNVALLSQPRKNKSLSRYLEITYSDTDNLPVRSFISAAEYCGLSLHSIDTLRTSKAGGDKAVKAVFLANGADIKTFLAFLAVDSPDHKVIGYYQRT